MSSNFNNAKIINVYYNKGDRKPYDVNGKPIAYIGEEFVGANEATELRFFLGEALDSGSAFIIAKRPNNDTRIDQLTFEAGANPYFKIALNAWYSEYKGKMTIIFKAYNGSVTFNEANTEITEVSGRIVVSDIFNLEIAYAPLATSTVPPFDPDPETSWYFALSTKLDKEQSITIVGTSLPALVDDEYDERFLMTNTGGVTRLYYINGNNPEEVIWQIGTLKLTATGGDEVTTNTGKVAFDTTYGGFKYTQIRDVVGYIGQDIEYYGKAVGTIAKGDVIQFDGVDGIHFLIKKAVPADVNANPEIILGIAKQGLTNNQFGYVLHFGRITGINLTAYADENYLWFASASANNGELTLTEPTAPNAKVLMGVVVDNGASGTLLVRPMIQPSLTDLKDIHITSIANNQVLRWNNTNLRWENTSALTTAETDIDALEVRMTTEEGNVDSLEGRMTSAENDISNIFDGTTIVPKANADKDNNEFDATYLKKASATATYIPLSQKGVANGVAPLGADNKILSIHLPGGVDDIKEFANVASFPLVGEASIIYVALDTNVIYRWSGTAYVEISSSLALGETSSTAFAGDRGLALETLTDNIVDGSQALALKDQVIRNTLTTTIPLVVNSIASTTANLTEFQVNGTKVLEVTKDGFLNQNGTRLFHQTGGSIFFGSGVGNLTLTNFGNTAFGNSALSNLTSGGNNTAVGITSLNGLTTGGSNVGVGREAGSSVTTGTFNTFIGRDSGFTGAWGTQLATATNSTGIGNQAYTDKSNQMVFGNASVSEFVFNRNTSALVIIPNLAVNRTDASFRIDVVSTFGNEAIRALRQGNYGPVIRLGRNGVTESTSIDYPADGNIAITTASTERMRILSNGNVGIGTASPAELLHINGATILSGAVSGGNSFLQIRNTSTNIALLGSEASMYSGATSSDVGLFVYGNNKLSLSTNATRRLVVDGGGNVGIGTSSPSSKLTLDAGDLKLQSLKSTNSIIQSIIFTNTNSSGFDVANIKGITGANIYEGVLAFDTKDSGGTMNERMRILSNGNVGIGTSAPTSLFQTKGANAKIRLTDTNIINASFNTITLFAADQNKFGFGVGGESSSPNHIVIDGNGGFVGINENTPTAQLQVKSGATNRVPLIVDTLASHATGIQEWRINGSAKAYMNDTGNLFAEGLANYASSINAYVITATTGTTISRNVADTNPALIVNLANASATGNIQVWQKAGSALSQISNAGIFVGQTRPTRTDITANATLALADEGKVLRVNPVTAADNITITIPKNSAVAFPIDTEIAIVRYNSGTVSIAPVDGDVTLQSANAERKIKNRYSSVALKKVGTDEWVLVGSLEA